MMKEAIATNPVFWKTKQLNYVDNALETVEQLRIFDSRQANVC
jgi:hypothetical protein